MLEDHVECEDPCDAAMPITDLKDVKDPDDVPLTCISKFGPREAGAYTVDALYHAKEGSTTDKEVVKCVILAHSADCITLTSLECPRNPTRLSCFDEEKSVHLATPETNEKVEAKNHCTCYMATKLNCWPMHEEV